MRFSKKAALGFALTAAVSYFVGWGIGTDRALKDGKRAIDKVSASYEVQIKERTRMEDERITNLIHSVNGYIVLTRILAEPESVRPFIRLEDSGFVITIKNGFGEYDFLAQPDGSFRRTKEREDRSLPYPKYVHDFEYLQVSR